MAMVNLLLLIISKVKDLMRIQYNNAMAKKHSYFHGMQNKHNKGIVKF